MRILLAITMLLTFAAVTAAAGDRERKTRTAFAFTNAPTQQAPQQPQEATITQEATEPTRVEVPRQQRRPGRIRILNSSRASTDDCSTGT